MRLHSFLYPPSQSIKKKMIYFSQQQLVIYSISNLLKHYDNKSYSISRQDIIYLKSYKSWQSQWHVWLPDLHYDYQYLWLHYRCQSQCHFLHHNVRIYITVTSITFVYVWNWWRVTFLFSRKVVVGITVCLVTCLYKELHLVNIAGQLFTPHTTRKFVSLLWTVK